MPNPRFLNQQEVSRMFQLMQENRPKPKAITDQKTKIEGATRALEFKLANGGIVTQADIYEVVRMKVELDGLYEAWIKGWLDEKVEIIIARS